MNTSGAPLESVASSGAFLFFCLMLAVPSGYSYGAALLLLAGLWFCAQPDPFVATLANTHNNYLEVWLHQGSFGLLALLALYWYALRGFCRRLRHPGRAVRVLAVSGASVMVSFFLFGLTQVILGRNNGVLFFLVSLAVFWGCMRHEENRAQGRPGSSLTSCPD